MSWENLLKQKPGTEIIITDVSLEAGGGNPEDPNEWVDFDIDDAEVTVTVDLYVEGAGGNIQIVCWITKVVLTGDGIEPTEIKEWEVDKSFPELSYYNRSKGIDIKLETQASISKHKDGTYYAVLYF
jgi:hypothetical protein